MAEAENKSGAEKGPLAGIRVLELCSTIAGPVCARLFGDFGADVIKVEPLTGDPVRSMGFHLDNVSLYAASILRNKENIAVNLKTKEGQEVVRELARHCDILVENFRPGTLERLGLNYEDLSVANPGLIMVRISGYGQTGPYRSKPGYGAICEAFGGIRYLTGDPDRPPARCAVAITDYVTAVYAAFGAMMALYERQNSGRGQVVDAALYGAAFSMMEVMVPAYDKKGIIPTRLGSRMHGAAPNNLYVTADQVYLLIAANNDAIFFRLARAMDKAHLIEDARFNTIRARGENMDLVDAEVTSWLAHKTADEAIAIFEAASVPVSKVYTIKDIFEDPHYRERDMLVQVESELLGEVVVPGVVPKMSRTPGSIRSAGKAIGRDTRAVLARDLGFSSEAVDALAAEHVVRIATERRSAVVGEVPSLSLIHI